MGLAMTMAMTMSRTPALVGGSAPYWAPYLWIGLAMFEVVVTAIVLMSDGPPPVRYLAASMLLLAALKNIWFATTCVD